MRNSKIYLFGIILGLTFSCTKKPEACIVEKDITAAKGDTIRFTSCSVNASTYLWKVNDNFLNRFDDPFFGDHFVVDGGYGCEDWIELSFFNAGTYEINLNNPVLKEGTCSSSQKSWSREDKTSVTVNITE